MKLGPKFTLILLSVFLVSLVAGGLVLWEGLFRRAQNEITSEGLLLIQAMNSVRRYTSERIAPLLAESARTEPQFVAEVIPAFSARQVFENFQAQPDYVNFRYKEASPNPRNLKNLSDEFEAGLIEQMQAAPHPEQLSGFRSLEGESVYYIARPLWMNSQSCLECHADPADAPASLLASYGSRGFGWEQNSLIAAQIVYVPASEVLDAARRSFLTVILIFALASALAILLINRLLRLQILHPVRVLHELAQKLSADRLESADVEAEGLRRLTTRHDELGELSSVFRRMAQEVYERTQSLKQEVRHLRIEIDEARRKKDAGQVMNSEYFQRLKEEARRQRQHNREEEE